MTSEVPNPGNPTQPAHPIVELTDASLAALLTRAVKITAVLGLVIALILWGAAGWRNAALFAVGAAISAVSIFEWQRLIGLFNARLDQHKLPRGTALVVGLFLVRLILFAGIIYVSLKCFQGSPLALVCGLSLAVAGLVWECLRMLRG